MPRWWLVEHPDAHGVALLLLLAMIVAWNCLSFDRWLARYDMLMQYLPWYAYLGEHLRALDIPG